MTYKNQRIRDPVHNLITFKDNQFENVMWKVIQTRPFQRLRRIKQLGFTDLVYPGTTHSRFAHSVGVFHTARQLMRIIKGHLTARSSFEVARADQALAAALVHDLGHGPFSHAFEDVGKRFGLRMAEHEHVSDELIKNSEIADVLKELGSGFADDVAAMIKGGKSSIYTAVVSSQFDADRLDYMRRDRQMTGTHHGAIDYDWLLANLEVGAVPYGVDDTQLGTVETFVLGPKAIHAAETYVLSLFQLYPTVYFHKTVRGVQKIFTELLFRVLTLIKDGGTRNTGLPSNHALVKFARKPNELDSILNLDDTVIWGALTMMVNARDVTVRELAERLRDRKLYKVIDVRAKLQDRSDSTVSDQVIDRACASLSTKISEWLEEQQTETRRVLIDQADRPPYKPLQESEGPLNQIMIRTANGSLVDIRERSKVVSALETFKLYRIYVSDDDAEARGVIDSFVNEEMQNVIRN